MSRILPGDPHDSDLENLRRQRWSDSFEVWRKRGKWTRPPKIHRDDVSRKNAGIWASPNKICRTWLIYRWFMMMFDDFCWLTILKEPKELRIPLHMVFWWENCRQMVSNEHHVGFTHCIQRNHKQVRWLGMVEWGWFNALHESHISIQDGAPQL
jgi:hypothetical protein